ncbi:uncharacterized protein METZ01_LOCUS343196 [marine metagenome]|uniref:WYL domain-containing protein n=1 Tax=marine metagenome TaxID=408172 RepID=A0A382QZL3_9ZZZZ
MGFGAQVEVVKPVFLRKEFKEKIKKLVKVYSG